MPASARPGAPSNVPIAVIGDHADLTYAYDYLGDGIETLAKVAAGKGFGEKLARPPRSRW